jgi:hypothetical protein
VNATAATPLCAKVSFPSEAEAWRRLFQMAFTASRRPRPVRPYWCGRCWAWHVTRRP